MSEFWKEHKNWHIKNNNSYDTEREYHEALRKHFEDWQPPKQLVGVPKFVAEWLDNKDPYIIATSPIPKEVIRWSQERTGYSDIGINISCLLELKIIGYTVEKEKLYEVIVGNMHIIKNFGDRNDHMFESKDGLVNWQKSGYQLTEAEIKAIDERFLTFAVEVDEVTE